MLGIPDKFSLTGLKNFVKKCILPEKLTDAEQIDKLAQEIKNLKKLQTQIKEEKKEAEEPFETARKKADIDLKAAREGKSKAGEPYEDILNWAVSTETKLRKLIVDFQSEQVRKKAEEEARVKALAEEVERKAREAEQAKINARKQGDNKAMMDAYKAQQEADDAQAKLATAENIVATSSSAVSLNTTAAKVLCFEVEDMSLVPDQYIDYVPNIALIEDKIRKAFPCIINIKFDVNDNIVPDEYMHDVTLDALILEQLRKGVTIPGIKKTYKDRLVVR